jgi:hypothetical protein
MAFQLLLVSLQCRSSARAGEDVASNESIAIGSLRQALFEVVGCTLSLKLECFCLQCSVFVVLALFEAHDGQAPR